MTFRNRMMRANRWISSDAAADYASNIIAGNSVYLGELSSEYGISFDEEFEKTMDKIEADYKEFLDKPERFPGRKLAGCAGCLCDEVRAGRRT